MGDGSEVTRYKPRALSSALAALLLAALLAGCARSGPVPSSQSPLVPIWMPTFYRVPAGATTEIPGTLLKAEAVAAPGVEGTAYRVMYVSTDVDGKPAAVTGMIFVPPTPPPSGGYPVDPYKLKRTSETAEQRARTVLALPASQVGDGKPSREDRARLTFPGGSKVQRVLSRILSKHDQQQSPTRTAPWAATVR